MREERVGLEDRVHVALVRGQPADLFAGEVDGALGGLLEAADHAQRRRLPTTGRAEHREEAAALDLETELVDGDDVLEALGDLVEADVRGRRRPGHFALAGDRHRFTR